MKPFDILSQTSLFHGLSAEVFSEYSSMTRVRAFSKGEIIAAEGDVCSGISVIERGEVALQKYTSDGDYSTIGLRLAGDLFGEDILFSKDSTYPFSLEAMSSSEVLYISKDLLIKLMDKSPDVKNNYLQMLSDKVHRKNRRIALLSQKTIRQKIAYFLLDLREDKTAKEVQLPGSREVIAKLLAMPRPSFSREMIAMEKEGLISISGRTVKLLEPVKLENDIVEGYEYTSTRDL